MYIANRESFLAFVERAAAHSVLAIDTEFLREKTYYAKLCLIQIATADEIALIDPFKVGSLKPLASLFEDTNIVKVFHSCDQDIEVLYHAVGVIPNPVFDTQVAAALLGHQKQIGYGALVNSVCGVSLRKADSLTDWSKRPLSDSQLSYAADDVIYLLQMYQPIVDKLTALGRLSWLDNDFAALVDPARYVDDPRSRFLRLKRANQLTRRQLSGARELAAWREEYARDTNTPRKWVLTDEQIVELCKRESRTIDDMFLVRGVREKLPTRLAREVLKVLVAGFDAPEDTWPDLPHVERNERNVDAEVAILNAILQLRAKQANVAAACVASTSELARLARGRKNDLDILSGWKYELVGRELEQFLAGELCVRIEKGKVIVEPVA